MNKQWTRTIFVFETPSQLNHKMFTAEREIEFIISLAQIKLLGYQKSRHRFFEPLWKNFIGYWSQWKTC